MKLVNVGVLVGISGVLSAGCMEQGNAPAPQTPASQPAAGPAAAAAPAPAPAQPMPEMQQQQGIKQKKGGIADDGI